MPPTDESRALLTDLYELSMACGHWKLGTVLDATFHVTFRRLPFGGGFAVACGLGPLLKDLEALRFSESDLAYLASLTGADERALFPAAFLDSLRDFRLTVDVDAVPEGTVAFAHEPLLRVSGPMIQAQLVETLVLNALSFPTLVATKAARVCLTAQGDPVIEFGLRRAQGPDGGLTASRAAYVGGCAATSNVLAGKRFGIPVKGTHAHSWVMAFDSEPVAFAGWAEAMPNNATFLVDTYDSLEGVRHAIEAGRKLRAAGHAFSAIRLDSGDLAWLSQEARRLLDEAGFPETKILASNELDERVMESLKLQGAAIDLWGVGTHLVTAFEEPALGCVYKLSAIRRPGGAWEPRVKLSEEREKTSVPGRLQTRRYAVDGEFACDVIYDLSSPPGPQAVLVDPLDATRRRAVPEEATSEDLLVPVLRAGQRVYDAPPLDASRERTSAQLGRFHSGIKRFLNPHRYPVGLEKSLFDRRTELVFQARGRAPAD